ncbi:MAG TPA: PQQ-dependent sugar dehydrogenase [Acidimicrobiales bacterium]|nr:PQQ-dependent sugar dehydrogenase [Acidimicrobiales bacterium]
MGARARVLIGLVTSGAAILAFLPGTAARAASHLPVMHDPGLAVEEVVSGLTAPVNMAFIGEGDILVNEKVTGRVQRVVDGVVVGTVLDLAVNFGSERGLLGIALHPEFPSDPGVYLYWTESSTGVDTNVLSQTPLLGNRVDRYEWNGSALVFDHNIIRIRAIQQDAGQPERGNHDGGVLAFGPDGNLYIFIGDLGRRGWLQNLACGPTTECPGPLVPDDQFGGPEPDDAHLSGVILRLNDDGTIPADNPFFAAGAAIGGEVGANIQRLFSYGHRNGFGIDFHPVTGDLWMQENGDDTFSEINRVEPGMNGGWIQIAGPVERIEQFKALETTFGAMALQQLRWPPTNIADSPGEALARLFMLPGAHYQDPELAWKWEIAPGGIGFAGPALGPAYENDLFQGAATPVLRGGYLFRLDTSSGNLVVSDPRLADGVADNLAKHDITESESLLVGSNFGVVTDIDTGPDGALYLVSITKGAIYRISATGITVDIDPVVPTDGSRGQVSGTITCDAGDFYLVELSLTQGDAAATGRQRGRCTGEPQEVRMGFATTGPAFSGGTASACMALHTAAPGSRTATDHPELCRPVTVAVR